MDEYIIDLDIDIIDPRHDMKKSMFSLDGIFSDYFHMNISRQKEKE